MARRRPCLRNAVCCAYDRCRRYPWLVAGGMWSLGRARPSAICRGRGSYGGIRWLGYGLRGDWACLKYDRARPEGPGWRNPARRREAASGRGRPLTAKDPSLLDDLRQLIEPATMRDPMRPLPIQVALDETGTVQLLSFIPRRDFAGVPPHQQVRGGYAGYNTPYVSGSPDRSRCRPR